MLVLGLTGNIGCGKSSVSTIFMNHGIEIVDADIVARHIFEDLDLLNKVFSTFGETIKNEDGSLNRKALGNIVFNDDEKLIALNNLTHPKIKQKILPALLQKIMQRTTAEIKRNIKTVMKEVTASGKKGIPEAVTFCCDHGLYPSDRTGIY